MNAARTNRDWENRSPGRPIPPIPLLYGKRLRTLAKRLVGSSAVIFSVKSSVLNNVNGLVFSNTSDEVLNIVCGAPNVRKGLKVIVALAGAKLPGGEIKRGVIRGVESNGMLCSMAELGLDSKFLSEKDTAGIHELDSDAPIGEDPIKYLGLDDDLILDEFNEYLFDFTSKISIDDIKKAEKESNIAYSELIARGLDTRIVFCCYYDTIYPAETVKLNNPERFSILLAAITRKYTESVTFTQRTKSPERPA